MTSSHPKRQLSMVLNVYVIILIPLYLWVSNAAGQPWTEGAQFCSEDSDFIDNFSKIVARKLSTAPELVPKSSISSTLTVECPLSTPLLGDPNGSPSSSTRIEEVTRSPALPIYKNIKCNKTNSTFLPFDEWRLANLNEAPLSKERRVRASGTVDLTEGDSIGDDMEIEIGFFSNVGLGKTEEEQSGEPEGIVYKHKFNFASLDCAATVVKTNSEAAGAASILIENKDKYLLNPCSAASQFIIVELCQDIIVEEIVIANFEYFSSTFSKVRFSVSDQYPVIKNGWRVLGEFEAENSRNVQVFLIDNPQIWARYLQIEILSHHDNEYYCPISIVRVHGKTMMDDFKMENSKSNLAVEDTNEVVITEKAVAADFEENCMDKIVEQCDLWPSINPNNITQVPQFPEFFKTCRSKLEPLKFEEFLRNLNESFCPPKAAKDFGNNVVSSSFSSQSASFSTEESIFKNIMKRLISLESNTTLTVQYIEEQGKLLSNSFEQLERTQTIKFENLITMFNDTIMDNLNVLRIFANQLKDQSIRILEEQKLNADEFTTRNMLRLESLEKEIKIQKTFIYGMASSILLTAVYLFLNKGDSYFDEMAEKDSIFNVDPLTPSYETKNRTAITSPASPFSFSESSNISEFSD